MPRAHSQEICATTMFCGSNRQPLPLFRTAFMFCLIVMASAATSSAQTFKTIHNFCSKTSTSGYCLDGQNPITTLVQGTNGALYGTTTYGGANNGNWGTIFKITTGGTVTTIYSFCAQANCPDGFYPNGALLLATDGNFYGVTNQGGAYGDGTVFKVTAAGKLTTLHSFDSAAGEGSYPEVGLIEGTDGNFYGTTNVGGAYSQGTVYKITASGTLTTLHSFCGGTCSDGANPNSPLIQAANGNFYGVAYAGGDSDCYPNTGGGASFQITLAGVFTSFSEYCQPNGFYPNSGFVQAANGNLYATTASGGGSISNPGLGTVYEMTTAGSPTWLYSFCLQSGCPDGENPQQLILATNGNLYGTTLYDGATNGTGTVFEMTPTGQLTTLHEFATTDGINPTGALVQHTNGTFYGATHLGGKYSQGTIFSLSTGLGAFVEPIPTSAAVGKKVTILGTGLMGSTAVSFNGTAATFKVVSATEITTTVPTGATSGTITVTTSTGTKLNSNVTFVIP